MQYTTGHDNIKTSMRSVYPQANAAPTLFARMAKSADKMDTLWKTPQQCFQQLVESNAVLQRGSGEIGRHTICPAPTPKSPEPEENK